MAEMERAYGVWPLGPKVALDWVWGTYENDAEHDIDCDSTMVEESMRVWNGEMRKTDGHWPGIQPWTSWETATATACVRWNLAKLIGEYARHNGHADLIRERIDGQTGE